MKSDPNWLALPGKILLASLFSGAAMAQTPRPEDAAGFAVCAGCGAFLVIIPLLIIALNIAFLVWVAKDAKARGMDTPALWMIVVLMTSFIGLIVYLFSRPAGNLVPCRQCGKRRLEASAVCPTCGNP